MSAIGETRSAPVTARKSSARYPRVAEDNTTVTDRKKQRIFRAVYDVASEIRLKDEYGVAIVAQDAILDLLAISIEAEAAKIAGYESWAALERAKATRRLDECRVK